MIGQFVEDFPSTRTVMRVTGQHYRTGKEDRNTYAPLVRKKKKKKGGGGRETRGERRTQQQSKPKTK